MAAEHCHSNDYWPITARLSRDSESRVVPGLHGSAVLIGCVAKHLPPPASDWPTNFRFGDARGNAGRGSSGESWEKPPFVECTSAIAKSPLYESL